VPGVVSGKTSDVQSHPGQGESRSDESKKKEAMISRLELYSMVYAGAVVGGCGCEFGFGAALIGRRRDEGKCIIYCMRF
jgi:hypothetical protein